jgi:Flp pilus assembly protein CpaB
VVAGCAYRCGVGESSLNPTLLSRVSTLLRPDWTRTVAARRVAAGGLVVLAAVTAVRSNPDDDRTEVVVATRDLTPGAALTPDDVRLEKRSTTMLPDGTQADLAAVIGSTLAGPTRRGEVLTDVRLLGTRLAESTAGPGARIVPLHLADGALIDLVRIGDVVDVLAAPSTEAHPGTPATSKVVATDAVVVLVSAKQKVQAADGDRVVLVALPARVANTVAGSVLGQEVTLTLH